MEVLKNHSAGVGGGGGASIQVSFDLELGWVN